MKILLHTIQAEKIGGTTTVINEIKNSYLKDKFEFKDLVQEEACGLNPIKAIRFVNKYRKLINQEHADAIYICGLLYSGFLMTLAAKLSNVKKIILAVHGSEWDRKRDSKLKYLLLCGFFEPISVRMATQVFTVCKKALDNPAIKRGEHGNVVGAIYNRMPEVEYDNYHYGIFRKEIGCSDEKILVAVVGRVVEGKGHAYIIDAIKHLDDNRFVFAIVGDGNYLPTYRKELKDKVEDGSVKLLGIRNDVFQVLRDSDVFLFATLHENHSKSMLEAVSMHCAIICTDVGGNPEIIDDEETGLMMPPRDSEAIIRNLKRLSDVQLREQLVKQAIKIIPPRFSVENTFGELEKLFLN